MTETAIRRARAGDLEALAELLEAHSAGLRARLRARVPATHRALLDADDVLQVTWLEAFLQIERLAGDTPAAFSAWLTRIAENNLRDGVRELERDKRPDPRRRADPQAAEGLLEALRSQITSPSRAAAREEAARLLEAALAGLPDDYARVVRLYDLEGRSIEATAAELGRSNGAVHMLRQRAHDRLRERLGRPGRYLTEPG